MINSFLPNNFKDNPQNLKVLTHSKTVANAAKLISQNIKGLDPEKAYNYGLLHDIGKFYLNKSESYKHPRKGYELLKTDYPEAANICISHAFPDFNSYGHILNYCQQDRDEATYVFNVLKTIEKTDYIDLIQLCDKLSGLDNFVSIEAKLDWYQKSCNINYDELKVCYFEPLKKLKKKFDSLANDDIYNILRVPK